MKKCLIVCLTCGLISGCLSVADKTEDVCLSSLLDEMSEQNRIIEPPVIDYKAFQVSSYDRRTISPEAQGWFANDDGAGFERLDTIDGRIEKVLLDEKGPGTVTRIWLTTSDKRGVLRFYFDGDQKPGIVVPAYDMKRFPLTVTPTLSLTHTHYKVDIEGTGGNTFFLPIPYAKQLKITFEEPDYTRKVPRYYHIDGRRYGDGVSVRTFSLEEADALSSKIENIGSLLSRSNQNKDATDAECMQTIDADVDTLVSMELPQGPKAIKRVKIQLSGLDSAAISTAARDVWISISFDGKRMVHVPADCFFGVGTGIPACDSHYTFSDGKGILAVYWTMPYKHHAEITLRVPSGHLKATLNCQTTDYAANDSTWYFHAAYKEENGIPVNNDTESSDNLDWNFATITGSGVYVGDLLSVNNHCPDWYGEGDEKIYVDNDIFPSFMGTGTEDYYNCSWAPVVTFSTPYGGAPRADEETSHGQNTFCRFRVLDVIPFNERLKFDIEMLSWTPGLVDYRTAVFWYGTSDSKAK